MPPIYIDQRCKVFVYNQHRLQNRHNGLRLQFYIDLCLVGFGTPFSIIEVASDWGYIDADVEIISTYTFRLFSGIHDTVTMKWWERERGAQCHLICQNEHHDWISQKEWHVNSY